MKAYFGDRKSGLPLFAILLIPLCILHAAEPVVVIHVSPKGNDTCAGTVENPLATLAAVQRLTRASAGWQPVTVVLHEGVYYLPDTLVFTEADSGTEQYPVVYAAAPGEHPVISGGMKLMLEWKPGTAGIME